jgi:hypothetical protein
MMVKMDLEHLANAIKKAKKHHVKVRHQGDEIYLVTCQNPEHKEPHAIYFEERKDGVYAACDCPARVACYHLISAMNLRSHVLDVRRASERAKLTAGGKKESLLQHLGTGKKQERVGGILT